jgi:hypothetical protein
MNQDIVPADKELRKKFIIFIVLVTILAILIEPYVKGYIEQIEKLSPKDPELAFKKSMFILKIALGFVSILLLSMGVYLVLLSRKILRSGQYPPPGMRVIRDTRLRTGGQARRTAISFIALSSILIILAFFFFYFPFAFEKTMEQKKHGDVKLNENVAISITLSGAVIGADRGDRRLMKS